VKNIGHECIHYAIFSTKFLTLFLGPNIFLNTLFSKTLINILRSKILFQVLLIFIWNKYLFLIRLRIQSLLPHTKGRAWIGGAYKILVRKAEEEWPFWRPRHRRENNIKIYLGEIWWLVLDWTHMTQDRAQWQDLINMVIKLWVP